MPTRRHVSRRHVTAGLAAAAFGASLFRSQTAAALAASLQNDLAAIEAKVGGRLGVAVLDTASGARADYRGNERFPICSTFKVLAVSAVLKRAEAGREHLDRHIAIKRADLIAYSPVLKDRIGESVLADADPQSVADDLARSAEVVLDDLDAHFRIISGGPHGAPVDR